MRRVTEPPRSRSILRQSVRIAAFAIAASCASCATINQQPAAPAPSISAELAQLSHRTRGLESVQSDLVMEYSSGDQHVKAREQLIAERPASLRVDAMSPFGVALVVVAHDGSLQIFNPSKNQLVRDSASAETLNRYVRIPMAPEDAVRLLMGLAPAEAQLDRAADSVTSADNMTVASWRGSDSATVQLGFDSGALAMVREFDASGAVGYDVRYSDYRDIGGIQFPYSVDAKFPSAGSHLSLRYDRPIINGAIPESAFILTPRNASEVEEAQSGATS